MDKSNDTNASDDKSINLVINQESPEPIDEPQQDKVINDTVASKLGNGAYQILENAQDRTQTIYRSTRIKASIFWKKNKKWLLWVILILVIAFIISLGHYWFANREPEF